MYKQPYEEWTIDDSCCKCDSKSRVAIPTLRRLRNDAKRVCGINQRESLSLARSSEHSSANLRLERLAIRQRAREVRW